MLSHIKKIGKMYEYEFATDRLVGQNDRYVWWSRRPQMARIFRLLVKLQDSRIPLLFEGEPGVGKKTWAEIMHRAGKHKHGHLLNVDCKRVTPLRFRTSITNLIAAVASQANYRGATSTVFCGTVVLHDVHRLSKNMQDFVLALLREKKLLLARNSLLPLDVRFIATTTAEMQKMVASGRFRRDLFFRLSVYPIALPRLAERTGDIEAFVRYFCRLYARQNRKPLCRFSKAAIANLQRMDWPYNLIDLRKAVFRSIAAANTDILMSRIDWQPPRCNAAQTDFRFAAEPAQRYQQADDVEQTARIDFSVPDSSFETHK